MLDDYYRNYYGYGVNRPENIERLKRNAERIAESGMDNEAVIVDFGGAGDAGESVLVTELHYRGFPLARAVGPGEDIPTCDILFASHVLEHVYDLPALMQKITDAVGDGWFVMDGPDSLGIVLHWPMPMLDWNTKHINHFTLRDYLNLGWRYGFSALEVTPYELGGAPAFQLRMQQLDAGSLSVDRIRGRIFSRLARLRLIDRPVNVWGLGDIAWHLLYQVDLEVLDYIDNDPAYRGKTYNGKPVQERPTNDAPIVILAQGQRARLIENIRKAGIKSDIIEV